MLTEVKMVVTPRLNEAIQKIVENKIDKDYLNDRYIYVEKDKEGIYLSYGNMEDVFNAKNFKEIDPIAFIASKGELEWLPLIGEEATFSNNKERWIIDKFVGYNHKNYKEDKIMDSLYVIKKQLKECKEKLAENGVGWKLFLKNCKTENQRWENISNYYENINNLKIERPTFWIGEAFDWDYSLQKNIKWNKLYNKLYELCEQNTNIVWEQDYECF